MPIVIQCKSTNFNLSKFQMKKRF